VTDLLPSRARDTGTTVPHADGPPESQPAPDAKPKSVSGLDDKVFRAVIFSAGVAVLVITGAVGVFLFLRAFDALRVAGFSFLTTQQWQPDSHHFGIEAILGYTVMIALVAVTVSTPLSIGTALFISEIAPARVRSFFISVIDLMAAVPSVIFGLWGLFFLQGHLVGVARWLATWLAWLPIFTVTGADPRDPLSTATLYTASTFIAGVVVGLMVAPIQCSIMREVFSQAPLGEREGAYALGSSRWGMIRTVVLPFGRGGMIGGTMLALGRALGETIAVYLIISPVFHLKIHILQSGAISVSSLIAIRYSEASGFGLSALFAAGLALFVLTLLINFVASTIVNRSRSGAVSE
jgi:phosphate transport system permease protein